ncbi:Acetyltransferase (GNAT) family protein [Pseudobythopirellula maris]|uniref:Acetyltransferase (GNAT) family protein n=1 Tax=Pseudobythopirellula maris TaxID=2527991 RepID=A0A5C5ZK44_9BACT|nr:GNAT family N-acetyltransferase [Pseudobythopirellula maris]TWT87498.1 Acetyltransferase (GNAT) family protein [Pseudobythopirellula maris]
MTISPAVYRTAKRAVDALPAWALRLRPMRVCELPLGVNPTPVDPSSTAHPRWIANREELDRLDGIADRVNLDRWDGVTARAALAESPDGVPLGALWIATGRFEEPSLGLSFELAPTEAWLHSAHVLAEHRRRGVYRALLGFAGRSLAEEGLTRILLGVSRGNEPSRRAHERAGAAVVGDLFAARSCGLTVAALAGSLTAGRGGCLHVGGRVNVRVDPQPSAE